MSRVDISFWNLYNTLPDELKIRILQYALHLFTHTPLDLVSSPKCLNGPYDYLLSPKFKDSEIAKEVFYRNNTFSIAPATTGNNVFIIPPEQYRKFIRHIHIGIFPTEREWAMLSNFKLKAHFPRLTSLTVKVDFRFWRSIWVRTCRHVLLSSRLLNGCYRCREKLGTRFMRAEVSPIHFDVRKLEVKIIPNARVPFSGLAPAPRPAEAKAFAYLKSTYAQDESEESVV
ncbi:uncharacterized protein N0V89_001537 [Didymosphaeria variabile]|uniref:Uncharacterized protein n=1 Tax=Didymosphaeria variabile TaxID=1932322 RepID=A0A9W8XXD9_9PLEO|nr:uncharacterized protein N0V89_001537 [Didymosphaeria variabile]KAJ4360968.1 hypothetical protein N0V89_001537 [Didymosphaeria variabile]